MKIKPLLYLFASFAMLIVTLISCINGYAIPASFASSAFTIWIINFYDEKSKSENI